MITTKEQSNGGITIQPLMKSIPDFELTALRECAQQCSELVDAVTDRMADGGDDSKKIWAMFQAHQRAQNALHELGRLTNGKMPNKRLMQCLALDKNEK